METSPVQMLEIPADDLMDNKENMVLRTLIGDPNRHIPLADHQPPSTFSHDNKPSTMYIVETRYQPIPTKVLPKSTDPKIYHIDSNRSEEPVMETNRSLERETPIPIQTDRQSDVPTVFLQPKIISQPIFYSILGRTTPPLIDEKPMPIKEERSSPTVYAITGRPRRPTIDMSVSSSQIPTPRIDQSPTVYALVGSPRIEKRLEEPPKQFIQPAPTILSIAGNTPASNHVQEPSNQFLRPSPNLYSIVGSPARTSRGVQATAVNPEESSPILYTIVGDTPPQTNRPIEKRPSKQAADATVYTLSNQVNPTKIEKSPTITNPTLYALVGKPIITPPQENYTKPPARKRTPPPPTTTTIINTRRVSRSLERKPEVIKEEIISYPIVNTTYLSPSKETKPSKSEAIFVPYNEENERRSRPKPPIEQTNHKPYIISQDQPIQLSDYHSPYAYRTHKPYRERKFNNNPLPVIHHTHSERKPRPPLYEPRYRVEKYHGYIPSKSISSERYPVNTKPRSSLWDNGYQTQTDDDEEYEKRLNKKKLSYRTPRQRAPWIPVW